VFPWPQEHWGSEAAEDAQEGGQAG
jgi:hypothetical protein